MLLSSGRADSANRDRRGPRSVAGLEVDKPLHIALAGAAADATVVLSDLLVNNHEDTHTCAQKVTEKYRARVAKDAGTGHHIVYADMSAIQSGDIGKGFSDPSSACHRKLPSLGPQELWRWAGSSLPRQVRRPSASTPAPGSA